MNFLAHVFLAGPDTADRLGALLDDFVKGVLPGNLPPAVAAGVELHRRIDSYAESHPAFRRSRARVSAERRRYAGIMIDLFYDHFLARHWGNFSSEPLEDFAAGTYALLAAHETLLPPRLGRIFPFMRSQDWLAGYRKAEAVALALDRMAVHRLSRPNRLGGSGAELAARYREFEQDFLAFLPDAFSFAADFRRSRRHDLPSTQQP